MRGCCQVYRDVQLREAGYSVFFFLRLKIPPLCNICYILAKNSFKFLFISSFIIHILGYFFIVWTALANQSINGHHSAPDIYPNAHGPVKIHPARISSRYTTQPWMTTWCTWACLLFVMQYRRNSLYSSTVLNHSFLTIHSHSFIFTHSYLYTGLYSSPMFCFSLFSCGVFLPGIGTVLLIIFFSTAMCATKSYNRFLPLFLFDWGKLVLRTS